MKTGKEKDIVKSHINLEYLKKKRSNSRNSYYNTSNNDNLVNEHPWTTAYILESCEQQIMNTIRKQCENINPKLKDDIHQIFRKLNENLNNIKVGNNSQMNKKPKAEDIAKSDLESINTGCNQMKEEIKLSNDMLKIEIDKMNFQLNGLMNSLNIHDDEEFTKKSSVDSTKDFNRDFHIYKKLIGLQKCLRNLTAECEKMEGKIKDFKKMSEKRNSTDRKSVV